MKNLFSKVKNFFDNYRYLNTDEYYLSQAVDRFDLEWRIKELDRRKTNKTSYYNR